MHPGFCPVVAASALAALLLISGCGNAPSPGPENPPEPRAEAPARAEPEAEPAGQAAASEGEARTLGAEMYRKHCLMCHQVDGSGVPGMQPPLKDSQVLREQVDDTIRRIVFGVRPGGEGPAPDSRYGNVMPAYRYLDDVEIAACVNYIRTEFAGVQDSSVAPEDVARIRGAHGGASQE